MGEGKREGREYHGLNAENGCRGGGRMDGGNEGEGGMEKKIDGGVGVECFSRKKRKGNFGEWGWGFCASGMDGMGLMG